MSAYPEEVRRLVAAVQRVEAWFHHGNTPAAQIHRTSGWCLAGALEPFLRDCDDCKPWSATGKLYDGAEWQPCPNPDCIDGKVIP